MPAAVVSTEGTSTNRVGTTTEEPAENTDMKPASSTNMGMMSMTGTLPPIQEPMRSTAPPSVATPTSIDTPASIIRVFQGIWRVTTVLASASFRMAATVARAMHTREMSRLRDRPLSALTPRLPSREGTTISTMSTRIRAKVFFCTSFMGSGLVIKSVLVTLAFQPLNSTKVRMPDTKANRTQVKKPFHRMASTSPAWMLASSTPRWMLAP